MMYSHKYPLVPCERWNTKLDGLEVSLNMTANHGKSLLCVVNMLNILHVLSYVIFMTFSISLKKPKVMKAK